MKGRIYQDKLLKSLRAKRLLWGLVWLLLFRPTPRWALDRWRIFLLKCFGAQIAEGCRVAPSCQIWAPWNLKMDARSALAEGVDCYCVDQISIGANVCVSQRAFLCSASHDISSIARPLTHKPVIIEDHAWVCAESFVGPGVKIGEGAVVAARAVVSKNVNPWEVVGGNPANFIKKRILEE